MTWVNTIARRALTSGLLKGTASTLAIRFAAAVAGFAMFALASREMSSADFGTLAMIFNAMSFLAVMALCGQETLIVRSWDEYCRTDRPALARGVLGFGAAVAIVGPLTVAVLVASVWMVWDRHVPTLLAFAACAFLFAQALMHFSGQFSRVAGGLIIGEVPRELVWRFIVVVALAGHHVLGIDFGIAEFFFISSAALLSAVAFQVWRVTRALPLDVIRATPRRDVAAWIARSFRMWLSALMDMTSQYLEVVVIGLALGPTAAGFYFVATRITNVFAMISGSMTIYATSQISGLFHADAKDELQRILRALAVISATAAAGAFAVILFGGHLLLSLFGSAYEAAYPALVVLALGAATACLSGPAAYTLLLTGNEGLYPRIMACGLAARFGLIAVLGPLFGLMGAAVAWSLSAVAIAIALVIASRRRVGIDPSLASAFGRIDRPIVPLPRSMP